MVIFICISVFVRIEDNKELNRDLNQQKINEIDKYHWYFSVLDGQI